MFNWKVNNHDLDMPHFQAACPVAARLVKLTTVLTILFFFCGVIGFISTLGSYPMAATFLFFGSFSLTFTGSTSLPPKWFRYPVFCMGLVLLWLHVDLTTSILVSLPVAWALIIGPLSKPIITRHLRRYHKTFSLLNP